MDDSGSPTAGGIFTQKTPILEQKLFIVIIATVVIVLAAICLILLFLRNRSSKRLNIGSNKSSGIPPPVSSKTGDEREADRRQVKSETDKVFVIGGVSQGLDAESDSKESSTTRSESSPASTDGLGSSGWGRWYSMRELQIATNQFSSQNVIGEGGYGIVYRGVLQDGSVIAVKKLLNKNLDTVGCISDPFIGIFSLLIERVLFIWHSEIRGQAEKEFTVEVEAIGKVKHKNLVSLLGYCAEGAQRLLVYEYIDNGNLEQWLHGNVRPVSPLTWEIRMKIAIGTARGYVSPDYASTGMLNEGSDVYSFGILLMEIITGRSPVDYSRPPGEMNLVDWFKGMVSSRRSEEITDPLMAVPPPPRALKRILLLCLRCIDLDAIKRPKMGQIVHMLEADEFPFRVEPRPVRDTASLQAQVSSSNRAKGR
ncbi:hypothetical protein SASPL_119724 [Salvia splendens]|uniref:non-specific serine/threonine protein kinase n=1 Tax=Salvia splendens TaxID=180675 RepID=A0A8X8XU26_SALSN|nr:hypothetical protein SASPL_119724 [Salvia splendens]